MGRREILASLAVLAALGAIAGCGSSNDGGGSSKTASKDPIKIGAIASLTGPAAPFGAPEVNSAKVVVDDVNAHGGVDGRKLELVTFDDATDPTQAARGATKLINSDHVEALIASTTGSATLALAPIAARAEVPVMVPAGTISLTDSSTAYYPWTFITVPSDKVAVPAIFDRVVRDGHSRVAVFFQEDAYGQFGEEAYQRLADGSGGRVTIVGSKSAPLTATDVAAQAIALRDLHPDAVIMQVSSPALGAAFARSAKQVGLDAQLYGSTGIAQGAFLQAAGAASNGMLFPVTTDPRGPTAAQQQLYGLLRAGGYRPAGGFADIIYSTDVRLLADALRRSKGEGGTALQSALNGTSGFDEGYWLAPISYTSTNHDGLGGDALVWAVGKDGAFAPAP